MAHIGTAPRLRMAMVAGIVLGILAVPILWLRSERPVTDGQNVTPAAAAGGTFAGPPIQVPLRGLREAVKVVTLPPVPYKLDQRHVRGTLHIVFSDGTRGTLAPNEEKCFGGSQYPAELRGDGTALVWLCPNGGCWREGCR